MVISRLAKYNQQRMITLYLWIMSLGQVNKRNMSIKITKETSLGLISLLSLKRKVRLMRSPVRLSVRLSPLNF
jgi:hypothetical protein